MSILLSADRRSNALHHLEKFLELTVYYKLPQSTISAINEHLAHLTTSSDELVTTVQVNANDQTRRTQVLITMDLKGVQDVTLKPNG